MVKFAWSCFQQINVLTSKTLRLWNATRNTSCLITGICFPCILGVPISFPQISSTINPALFLFNPSSIPVKTGIPHLPQEGWALTTSEHQHGSRSTALHAWRKHPRLLEWVQVPPSPLWWQKPALGRGDLCGISWWQLGEIHNIAASTVRCMLLHQGKPRASI